MNNKEFLKTLCEKASLEEKDAIIVNYIIDEYIPIGKKSGELIVSNLMDKLKVDEVRAKEIYDAYREILKTEIKDKLKHPFKDLDNED